MVRLLRILSIFLELVMSLDLKKKRKWHKHCQGKKGYIWRTEEMEQRFSAAQQMCSEGEWVLFQRKHCFTFY